MDGIKFDDEAINSGLAKIARFELDGPDSLPENEKKVIGLLAKASKIVDEIFMSQMCPALVEIEKELEKESDELSAKRLEYLRYNKSQFDALNGLKPFIEGPGISDRIAVYPDDITKSEFEDYAKKNQDLENDPTSYYNAIVRENGNLKTIKFSELYKVPLGLAAKHIMEAAKETVNESLRKYLYATAEALITNDYAEQQLLWLKLDSNIEPTIGPYETYEDRLFGYKGFFESYISIRDNTETEKLQKYAQHLTDIDASLPISKSLRFTRKEQSSSPIVVVDEVVFGGEANAGFVTSAFNLPNEERVRSKYGSKKVLMGNIIKMKFEMLTKPVGERLLESNQTGYLDRNVAKDFVLFHELSHGLGAAEVITDSGKKPVTAMLKDMFSHIEEARADVTGIYCAKYFHDKGMFDKDYMQKFYVSYFASDILRGMRMGLKEAHAMGQAIEYNFIKEKGGITFDKNAGKFGINQERIWDSVLALVKELNDIEASGDYERAKKLTEKYCNVPEELAEAYARIKDIPIEIYPLQKNL